jgi:hypothetical protein
MIGFGSLNTVYNRGVGKKKIDRQKSKSFVTDWVSPEKRKKRRN